MSIHVVRMRNAMFLDLHDVLLSFIIQYIHKRYMIDDIRELWVICQTLIVTSNKCPHAVIIINSYLLQCYSTTYMLLNASLLPMMWLLLKTLNLEKNVLYMKITKITVSSDISHFMIYPSSESI